MSSNRFHPSDSMQEPDEPHAFEVAAEDYAGSFSFDVEAALSKTVTVQRRGRLFTVAIEFIDGIVTDETQETFEADGPVRISVTKTGLYLTSYRNLLAGRARLRRTRFF
jgi:hypothetical protein